MSNRLSSGGIPISSKSKKRLPSSRLLRGSLADSSEKAMRTVRRLPKSIPAYPIGSAQPWAGDWSRVNKVSRAKANRVRAPGVIVWIRPPRAAGPRLIHARAVRSEVPRGAIRAHERSQRQADDIGTGYRIAGESEERPWPLSPVPLMIDESEWARIEAGANPRVVFDPEEK